MDRAVRIVPTHRLGIDVAVDQLLNERCLAHTFHPTHQHLADLANFGVQHFP